MFPVEYLQSLIADAGPNDPTAERLLREIVRKVADAAPLEALKEVAETLVTIRKRDGLMELEKN